MTPSDRPLLPLVTTLREQPQTLGFDPFCPAHLGGTRGAVFEGVGDANTDLTRAKKATPWKVALANHLKLTTTASNPWIARRLHMGDPDGVSRYCTECRSGKRPEAAALQTKITDIRV